MISLFEVTKSFGSKRAIEKTSIEIAARRSVALLGPSGCGKSTLLRMIVGLIEPDSGHVTVGSERLTRESASAIRRRIGYVIQDGGLFPHLSAADNATLMARHLGWPAAKIAARLEELAALVRLEPAELSRFPVELSGGQRQRVGLLRALFLDPDVLLLDEPLGALDPIVRSKLQEDLKKIVRELDKTVVLVTHDMAEAAFLADDLLVLRGGRVVQRGGLRDLLDHPADPFVTDFLNAQRSPWWAA